VVVPLVLECLEKRFCLRTVVAAFGVSHVVQGRLGGKLKRLCIGCPARCGIWPHRRYIPTHANRPSLRAADCQAECNISLETSLAVLYFSTFLGLRDAPAVVVASSRGKQPHCPVGKHEQAHGSAATSVSFPQSPRQDLSSACLGLSTMVCKISILPLVLGLLLRILFPFLCR
jgi:hypothetical protein